MPGGDGALDLTEVLAGRPTYERRTGSWEFIVMNDYGNWADRYSEIMAHLQGKEFNITVIEHIISANPINDFKVMICKIQPDLIVIANHGKTYDKKPYNDSRLGSVAKKVLEVSNVPVIISK